MSDTISIARWSIVSCLLLLVAWTGLQFDLVATFLGFPDPNQIELFGYNLALRLNFAWMAWTLPTALFFTTIFLILIGMGVWEYFSPGGNPRIGILRFETTRGDRLFVSLLGSAFIHLAWLGLVGPNLWWALALSVVYAIGVFRFV